MNNPTPETLLLLTLLFGRWLWRELKKTSLYER